MYYIYIHMEFLTHQTSSPLIPLAQDRYTSSTGSCRLP